MKSERDRSVFIAIGLLFIIGWIGVIGYMIIEDLDFTRAVYMTVITIATVGFKEVVPLSSAGMWFTSFLIIISFGIFVFTVTTFTRYVIDGIMRNYYRDRKVRKRIENLSGHTIICGYGRNGSQAGLDLSFRKIPFVIIENNPEIIQRLSTSDNILYVEGDATKDEILQQAGIGRARALITTLPFDTDNLYVVLTAREINPNLMIISRASNEGSDVKLKRAGASNVIMPDRVGGQRMAKLVIQPDVVEFIDFIMLQEPDSVFLEELNCETIAPCFEGKKIRELDIRNRSGANIIGLKHEDGSYIINPSPDEILSRSDRIFVLGNSSQIHNLRNLLTAGEIK